MDLLMLAASSLFAFQGVDGRECGRSEAQGNVLWVHTAGNRIPTPRGAWGILRTHWDAHGPGCACRAQLAVATTVPVSQSTALVHISPVASHPARCHSPGQVPGQGALVNKNFLLQEELRPWQLCQTSLSTTILWHRV